MMRRWTWAFLAAGLLAAPARAWEADTTHAGLTEAAALSSTMNARLRMLYGRAAGWLELLAIAPERSPALYKKLGLVEPGSGLTPDKRGRQSALSWLVAGAVLEGIPGERDRNHFYDPVTRKGLGGGGAGIFGKLRGEGDVPAGMAAPDWIAAKENDVGLARFWTELEQSSTARTPAERDEHLALALLSAGSMTHVLQDLGVPAHVRNDLKEHLSPLGAGPLDRGSRFERLAAFVYGRLGVPEPSLTDVPARARARDLFTAADGKGLADLTAARFYSGGTLPADIILPAEPRRGEIAEKVLAAHRTPAPHPLTELRLRGDGGPDGHALRDAAGVCLANYRVEDGVLKFVISDACAAEQIAVILPQVGGYSVSFLDWLFRGALDVHAEGDRLTVSVGPGGVALGKGKLSVYTEAADGLRTLASTVDIEGNEARVLPAPAGAKKIVVVFRGVDAAGEDVVAVGGTY